MQRRIHWFQCFEHSADRGKESPFWRILAVIYAVVLFFCNFIRIFDNNFWGDEAYTIRLSQMKLSAMFAETAGDVHPPLYYMLVKLVGTALGFRSEIFHFASLIPYAMILILALTVIWKRYGKETAILLMTLSSLLPIAVQYNVEVRMYSWGALFVLLSYLFLWRILSYNGTKDYVGFVGFSLAGAYTHYYCIVMVAFFYCVLILLGIIQRKKYLLKVLISCAITIGGYLPWFFILLSTFERTSGDFWMVWIPTLRECIGYFFGGKFQFILFGILILAAVLSLMRMLPNHLKSSVPQEEPQESCLKSFLLSTDMIWMLSGFVCVFGTVLVGIMVSRMVRPLFIVRYLYPSAIIVWLLLGYCLSRLKGKVIYTVIVLGMILYACIPQYIDIYLSEKQENSVLIATLNATASEIGKDDVILTDLLQVDWTISDYYYPGVRHQVVDREALPVLEEGYDYWMILEYKMGDAIQSALEGQGYFCEEVVDDGILGTSPVYIYKLSKEYID